IIDKFRLTPYKALLSLPPAIKNRSSTFFSKLQSASTLTEAGGFQSILLLPVLYHLPILSCQK
ncbi:hypothetical protein, partial [Akkermansia sp.]